MERILGQTLSLATLEQQARRSAQDVASFYAQPQAQFAPAHTGSILVAQADGKGVPLVTATAREAARLATSRKRGTKKEAVVTCLVGPIPGNATPGATFRELNHNSYTFPGVLGHQALAAALD